MIHYADDYEYDELSYEGYRIKNLLSAIENLQKTCDILYKLNLPLRIHDNINIISDWLELNLSYYPKKN
jgi:hypothetical protein